MRGSPIRCSHETDEPSLADRIEVRPDVRVENEVHLFAGDPDDKGIQRIVLSASGPEPVREPEEVFLVDRVQHRYHCPLDDLVLQRSDSEWTPSAIWLWYVPSPRWQCPICSPLNSCMQIREPELEVCLVVLPRQSVYTRCGVPFQLKEREPKEINVDVVEERGELFLLPVPCCLSYAFQRL